MADVVKNAIMKFASIVKINYKIKFQKKKNFLKEILIKQKKQVLKKRHLI